jgi:hypothetical protein
VGEVGAFIVIVCFLIIYEVRSRVSVGR